MLKLALLEKASTSIGCKPSSNGYDLFIEAMYSFTRKNKNKQEACRSAARIALAFDHDGKILKDIHFTHLVELVGVDSACGYIARHTITMPPNLLILITKDVFAEWQHPEAHKLTRAMLPAIRQRSNELSAVSRRIHSRWQNGKMAYPPFEIIAWGFPVSDTFITTAFKPLKEVVNEWHIMNLLNIATRSERYEILSQILHIFKQLDGKSKTSIKIVTAIMCILQIKYAACRIQRAWRRFVLASRMG